jgi:hypothetical protein
LQFSNNLCELDDKSHQIHVHTVYLVTDMTELQTLNVSLPEGFFFLICCVCAISDFLSPFYKKLNFFLSQIFLLTVKSCCLRHCLLTTIKSNLMKKKTDLLFYSEMLVLQCNTCIRILQKLHVKTVDLFGLCNLRHNTFRFQEMKNERM